MTSRDRKALNALLRTSFPDFVRRTFATLNPAATFLENWHVEAILYHLELVRIGKIRRRWQVFANGMPFSTVPGWHLTWPSLLVRGSGMMDVEDEKTEIEAA
jgi:hypothetical protein